MEIEETKQKNITAKKTKKEKKETGIKYNEEEIFQMLKIKKQSEIVKLTGLSKGRISQLNKKMEKIENLSYPEIIYFEYYDHASCNNELKLSNNNPPILACVGEIIEDRENHYVVKSCWSKTFKNKVFQYTIILKKVIVKQVKFEPKLSKLEQEEIDKIKKTKQKKEVK